MSTKGHPPSRTLFPRPRRPRWPGSQRHTLPPVSERVLTSMEDLIIQTKFRRCGLTEVSMEAHKEWAKAAVCAGPRALVRTEVMMHNHSVRIRVEHHPDERTLRFKTHAERNKKV